VPADVNTERPGNCRVFSLHSNFPNPFNATTRCSYSLAHESQVRLRVLDITGAVRAVLVDERQTGGTYTIPWDASRLSTGIYIIEMTADSFRAIHKAMLIK